MSKYFPESETGCHCGCGVDGMSPEFIQKLEELRELFGSPMPVTSGYRCPRHNDSVSRSGLVGPHTTGHAADIRVCGAKAHLLLGLAFAHGGFSGIGISQKGTWKTRFIHLDDLEGTPHTPRPTIWSY